jgi:hypothetical protein
MLTAKAPAATRAQAARIICSRLPGPLTLQTRVAAAGAEVLCDLLIALERAFDIGLDVAEVWPAATVGDLVALVEAKVGDLSRKALIPANDAAGVVHFPAEPTPFVRRRPIVAAIPPPRPAPEPAFVREREAARRIARGRRICIGCAGLALVVYFGLGGR